MSDDFLDRMALHEDPTTEFARTAQIRDSAQKALIEHKDKDSVMKAKHVRSRKTRPDDINVGSACYVWRSSPRSTVKGWVGPGLAVCLNEQNQKTSD